MVSPTSRERSASVTRPTVRKQHSMYPVRVGAEAMQKVDSPAPNAEYSANWPARKVKFSRTFSSWNTSLKLLMSGVSSMTCSMVAKWGM